MTKGDTLARRYHHYLRVDRRIARVALHYELLEHILRADIEPCITDAPSDLRVVSVTPASWSADGDAVTFIVWSETFAYVPSDAVPPLISFRYERVK